MRLLRGDMNEETVFNDDPAAQAEIFEQSGFDWLHIVDLNGAIKGLPVNYQAVTNIVSKVKIPVQLGGGIRSMNTIEHWIALGLTRIILGTVAINNPKLIALAAKEFPNKIAVSIDAKNGYVATNGWTTISTIKTVELAKQLEDIGVCAIIFTDIERDGAMNGPNLRQTENLANAVTIPIIASGGISSLQDLKNLKRCNAKLNGVISGRAIYEKAFSPNEAINLLRSQEC